MFRFSSRITLYTSACLILTLLVACARNNHVEKVIYATSKPPFDIGDGGFLSESTCVPACFWNITPGISDVAEVRQILQDKNVSQYCGETYDTETAIREIRCGQVVIIEFQPESDIVASIVINPSKKITMAEMIEVYGEPNAVIVAPAGIQEPETAMALYYNDINISIWLGIQDSATYLIDASTTIENIAYFDKATYEEVRQYASSWKGYGEYIP